MRIYVSGPITGIKDDNRPAFERKAAEVAAGGNIPIIPHDVVPEGVTDHATCMRYCIRALVEVDAMTFIETGRPWSKGMMYEAEVAKAIGLPILDIGTFGQILTEVEVVSDSQINHRPPIAALERIARREPLQEFKAKERWWLVDGVVTY